MGAWWCGENLFLPSPDSFGSNLTPKALTPHTQMKGNCLSPSLLCFPGGVPLFSLLPSSLPWEIIITKKERKGGERNVRRRLIIQR